MHHHYTSLPYLRAMRPSIRSRLGFDDRLTWAAGAKQDGQKSGFILFHVPSERELNKTCFLIW